MSSTNVFQAVRLYDPMMISMGLPISRNSSHVAQLGYLQLLQACHLAALIALFAVQSHSRGRSRTAVGEGLPVI